MIRSSLAASVLGLTLAPHAAAPAQGPAGGEPHPASVTSVPEPAPAVRPGVMPGLPTAPTEVEQEVPVAPEGTPVVAPAAPTGTVLPPVPAEYVIGLSAAPMGTAIGVPTDLIPPVVSHPAPPYPGYPDDPALVRGNEPSAWARGLDSFDAMPLITRIVPPGMLRDEIDRTTVPDPNGYLERTVQNGRIFTFEEPARFPQPRFDRCNETFEDEGMVIYEGMNVALAPDGRYAIRFVASTPAVPVTLRLQLKLRGEFSDPRIGPRTGPTPNSTRVITLPPIVMPPFRNVRGEFEAATWQVQFAGYSAAVQERSGTLKIVSRAGVARFGSYPTAGSAPSSY